MSVRQINKFIGSSGCGTIVGAIIAIGMIAGVATTFFGRGQQQQEQRNPQEIAIAMVGQSPVNATEIAAGIQRTRDATAKSATLQPLQEVEISTREVKTAVDAAIMAELAKKYSVTVSDADMLKEAEQPFDIQVMMLRSEMERTKKLKPGATDAEFEKVLKAEGKISDSLATLRNRYLEQVTKDPAAQASLRSSAIRNALVNKFKGEATLSDADLKASLANLTVKRVFVRADNSGGPAKDPKSLIAEADAELKKNVPFEDVMAKYSQDPVASGQSIKTATQTFIMSQAFTDPGFAPMKTLKVNEVSPVMEVEGGYAIYKVLKIDPSIPAEFDKIKEGRRSGLADQVAQQRLTQELKAFDSGTAITWKDAGAQALYMLGQELSTMSPKMARLEEILKLNGDAETRMRQWLAEAKYGAISLIWSKLSEADKTKRADEKLLIIQEYLTYTDGPYLRLELADLLKTKKDINAGEQLLQAALNTTRFDPAAANAAAEIRKRIKAFQDSGVLAAETKTSVERALDEWQNNKKLFDESEAKRVADEAKQRAEAEAAAKKAEEESKKSQKLGAGGNVEAGAGGASEPSSSSLGGSAPAAPADPGVSSGATAGGVTGSTAGTRGGP